ncbi:MAG: hypothetical protein KAI83_05425, partial [Thiomargarita sp.]|nr:hypothetical protein [Thiomargarita sp.]
TQTKNAINGKNDMNRRILFLICLLILVPVGCNKTAQGINAQDEVDIFLTDMNPELHQTSSKMRMEIVLADKKIQQLYDLKGMYPDQRDMINKSIKQWQTLRKQLKKTLNNIYDKVEAAYVAYKIDDIQGRKKFSRISTELLKESQTVLANAEIVKSTIERELYE